MTTENNSTMQNKPVDVRTPRRRGRTIFRFLLLLILLGGSVITTLIYSEQIKNSRFAQITGLRELCGFSPEKMAEAKELTTKAEAVAAKGERKILYYVDPMNPTMRSDKPGKAPCGMDLIPVYEEEETAPGETASEEAMPPGTIKMSAQRQQLIGVKYDEIREQPLSKAIRTVGRLTYDETKIAHIHTRISGWIDKVFVDFTGKLVKKGQPLLTIYSPELVSTQQELLIARKSKELLSKSQFIQGTGSNSLSLYDSTRERLRLWEIPESEIREIEKRGTPNKTLTLFSPLNGFVLDRKGFSGHQVSPEMELYSIADLSTIWVIADVYEYELPMIEIGQKAEMSLAYFPGKIFTGRVAYIYPGLEQETRTLKVRVEFPNPNYELKPDMYANVEIKVDYGTRLAISRDAVMDSGADQIAFVARDGGYFEPRKLSLGQQVGDQFIVLSGLKPGERVVTSANFLIDSESQLKSALGGMGGGAHSGHGGGSPAGGDKNGKTPAPSKNGPLEADKTDHSQHEAKQPSTRQPEKLPGTEVSPGSPGSDHAGHSG